jgi:hypothetical protein
MMHIIFQTSKNGLMEKESMSWTTFTCPQVHYEWLVMQNFFNENQEFVLIYIDDLLIFSKTYKEHIAHLDMFFRKVEQNGLILSKKKMEICKEKITS